MLTHFGRIRFADGEANSCKLSNAADLNTRRREATGQCKNVILVHFNEPTGAKRANLKTPLPSCFHSASTSRGFLLQHQHV